jgi:hypothetical protein
MHGYDRVRNSQIGKTEVPLKYFEEVFTSEHWMMRIYRCDAARWCVVVGMDRCMWERGWFVLLATRGSV